MPEPVSKAAEDLTTSKPLQQQSSVMDPSLVSSTPTALAMAPSASKGASSRDSSWLELEVCREYSSEGCPRGEFCDFAHSDRPSPTGEGKLTCCYDFLKDRCHRDHCKYFHPPPHIKERLVTAGKQFGAMMSGFGGTTYQPMPTTCATYQPVPPTLTQYSVLPAPYLIGKKLLVCPDYSAGQCSNHLCTMVHPEHYVGRNPDGTVTMCRDFVRSTGCPREQCRFYHPLVPPTPEAIGPTGFYTPPQGMYMLPPGFQQSTPLYYSPTSTLMFFPGSGMFPTNNSQVLMPVSYPPVLPLPSPLPVQSMLSVNSESGELSSPSHSQTIISHQTIQH